MRRMRRVAVRVVSAGRVRGGHRCLSTLCYFLKIVKYSVQKHITYYKFSLTPFLKKIKRMRLRQGGYAPPPVFIHLIIRHYLGWALSTG